MTHNLPSSSFPKSRGRDAPPIDHDRDDVIHVHDVTPNFPESPWLGPDWRDVRPEELLPIRVRVCVILVGAIFGWMLVGAIVSLFVR